MIGGVRSGPRLLFRSRPKTRALDTASAQPIPSMRCATVKHSNALKGASHGTSDFKPFRFHTRSGVISTSGAMFDRISARVMRCNGAYAARRGEYDGIMADLFAAKAEMPDHFKEKGDHVLGTVAGEWAA